MATSAEKSALLLIGGKDTERRKVHLYLSGQEILRLGVPVSQKGRATLWLQQIKRKWDATIHLIHRIGTKFGGAGTKTIRNIGKAVLISRP